MSDNRHISTSKVVQEHSDEHVVNVSDSPSISKMYTLKRTIQSARANFVRRIGTVQADFNLRYLQSLLSLSQYVMKSQKGRDMHGPKQIKSIATHNKCVKIRKRDHLEILSIGYYGEIHTCIS